MSLNIVGFRLNLKNMKSTVHVHFLFNENNFSAFRKIVVNLIVIFYLKKDHDLYGFRDINNFTIKTTITI
jgi:hypothetical protein